MSVYYFDPARATQTWPPLADVVMDHANEFEVARRRGVGYQNASTGDVVLGVLWLIGRTAGGYYAGMAMAPATDRRIWGLAGGVVGLLTGPIGLGVMGAMALSGRR